MLLLEKNFWRNPIWMLWEAYGDESYGKDLTGDFLVLETVKTLKMAYE